MRTMIFALLAIAFSSINAVGEDYQVKNRFIACKSADDASKLISFIRAGDNEAAANFFIPKSLTGECMWLEAGGKVFSELSGTRAILSGLMCVRRRGETDCFYTLSSNLQEIK
jgi:hypothetical protein